MPVIPTYSTGIGAPDLAGAFLGGRRIRLSREQIAQQAASDAARIQLGREEIAQRAVQNEMELAAKKEALSRESLRKAQEAEILKAYRETQLGLAEGRLRNQEALAELRIQQAAIDFDKMQNYQRRVQELTGKNIPLEEAARQAILEYGGTGLSTALERPQGPAPRKYSAVAGVDTFGLQPPTRLSMTGDEFQSFIGSAPPELRTNSVNMAIQNMLQPARGTNAPATVEIPTVTTKAEFDALPKGSEYIGKNGKRYRKP